MEISLPTFAGKHTEFELYRLALLTASATSSVHQHGLDGFLFSAADYSARYNGEVFIPLVHPGAEPDPNQVFSVTTHSAWRFRVEQFQLQRKDLQTLLNAVLTSLSPSIRILMWNADGTQFSLLKIFETLKSKYGKISPSEYNDHVATLDRVFQESDDFEEFIAYHISVHRIAVLAEYPLGDALEVNKLRQATINCAIFRSEIEAYQRSFDDIKLQTFAGLSSALLRAWRYRGLNTTAASAGWAATVQVAQPPQTTTPQVPAVTLESLYALLLKTNNLASPQVSTPVKKNNRRSYCWTHGETFHSSNECLRPADGHDHTATWSDRKGGKKSGQKQRP
jgi:hypothetical protein